MDEDFRVVAMDFGAQMTKVAVGPDALAAAAAGHAAAIDDDASCMDLPSVFGSVKQGAMMMGMSMQPTSSIATASARPGDDEAAASAIASGPWSR